QGVDVSRAGPQRIFHDFLCRRAADYARPPKNVESCIPMIFRQNLLKTHIKHIQNTYKFYNIQ
ncbi:hypothetical protein, partial [Cardiobacterium valvarum]|uniref:hypothetical protein n=1 Tax=Cardiobacterium valvarum TaxID=194702 RepID=UPI001C11E4C7